MKKIKISQFIGRQLSRLKIGQGYYAMGMSSIATIGILKIAFPQISIWSFLWILIPIMFGGTFALGYIMDKSNVITMDYNKSIEMTQRYLTKLDLKVIDFQTVQMKCFFEWFKAIQDNKPLDFEIFEKEYKKFLKRYSPPEEK